MCKVGYILVEYIKIKFFDIIILLMLMGGIGLEDWVIENVVLNFVKFEVDYML